MSQMCVYLSVSHNSYSKTLCSLLPAASPLVCNRTYSKQICQDKEISVIIRFLHVSGLYEEEFLKNALCKTPNCGKSLVLLDTRKSTAPSEMSCPLQKLMFDSCLLGYQCLVILKQISIDSCVLLVLEVH